MDLLEKPNFKNLSNSSPHFNAGVPDRVLQVTITEDSQSELRWRHGPWPIELSPRLY